MPTNARTHAPTAQELIAFRAAFTPVLKRALGFTALISVLSLAPTLYMFEVYGRVINSLNVNTLLMLSLALLILLGLMEVLDWVRGRLLQTGGLLLEEGVGDRVFDAVLAANLIRPSGSTQAFSDVRTVREFLSSPAFAAILDAPTATLFLILLFLIHPLLGGFALVLAAIQVYIAYATERTTNPPLAEANRMAIAAQTYAGNSLRQAQAIEAMGMMPHILQRWMGLQRRFLAKQAEASDHAGGKGAVSKALQQTLSSGLLGLSAWLLLQNDLPGGGAMLIVASILGGKTLSPLVQVIAGWKQVVGARLAWQRLNDLLLQAPVSTAGMSLPPPQGHLSVEGVIAAAPGSQAAILRGVSFHLPAGRCLMVVGPSAAGKTTLARVLTGVWPTLAGKVRLDGVDVHGWDKTELGPHVGYLPQDIELFAGTVAENVARFGEVDMALVEQATRLVGLHETILALPHGYDTPIGEEGAILSGGQRQRLALARAIYGMPRFLVLDEPNSNLDEAGDAALLATLSQLKAAGSTIVVVSHRTSILPVVDAMLVLREGQIAALGPRDEVLAALAQPRPSPPAQAAALTTAQPQTP
ncbi:MAG: type I secretion system permease/ATPase [Thiobacillaceae bacterium]|nr:type I secretion system permease/ATPase [Thiobacillaceae bacterium]MDW8324040.1 type I secretion system permease/ATPase [Burkholderiales bacterium]